MNKLGRSQGSKNMRVKLEEMLKARRNLAENFVASVPYLMEKLENAPLLLPEYEFLWLCLSLHITCPLEYESCQKSI